MKYTAGELRKMNGKKCKIYYNCNLEAEGEIYICKYGAVYLLYSLNGRSSNVWRLYNEDDSISSEHDSITFLD